MIGPNNAGKSTVLEALDLLLHPGFGRPRPAPSELDYFARDPSQGFVIEAIIGNLSPDFLATVRRYLEGWESAKQQLVPEPEGEGIEPVVRVRVSGTDDFDLSHEFSKEEAGGARFSPSLREEIGWVFDGRAREPSRQLAFYQGGLLDRLFRDVDLNPAAATLRRVFQEGTSLVNADDAVKARLADLAKDLRAIGLVLSDESPLFEAGAISMREILQGLRLTLPGSEAAIPIFRHGRGAQRLLLVALLIRLARTATRPVIGGFEEPEEALEPVRQTQVARMLRQLVDQGGQIFVVTHSPEIARAFFIEDFLLLDERAAGEGARLLRNTLSPAVKQTYERRLDGAVVRALFARVPFLVEGPSDRVVAETFWSGLAARESGEDNAFRPADQLGLDVVNCEGAGLMPMMARLLNEAGKSVVVWAEADRPDILATLRQQGHCAAIVLYEDASGHRKLEEALAQSASRAALLKALNALATTRGYSWDEQRTYLVSAAVELDQAKRTAMNAAPSLERAFEVLDDIEARSLIATALAAKDVAPFEMKGARQGRTVAEAILEVDTSVPAPFARAFRSLHRWITQGCQRGAEFPMAE